MTQPQRITRAQYQALRDEGYDDDEIRAEGYVVDDAPDFSNVESGSASINLGRRPGRGTLGAVAQLGQNWADESMGALAAMDAVMKGRGFKEAGQRYKSVQRDVEEAASDFSRRNPKTAIGLQVGSALVPMGAGLKVANTAGKLARVVSSAPAIGAAGGAFAGAGAGHGGERVSNAVTGGALGAVGGAVLGAAAPVVAKGVRAVAGSRPARGAMQALQRMLPSRAGGAVAPAVNDNVERAFQVVAEKFADDGIPPDQITAAIANARNGDPELLLNLGGENVAALARVVQSIPGRGKQVVQSALDEQSVAIPELVTRGVERAVGRPIPNAPARIDELAGAAAKAAKPHYQAIENQFLPNDPELAAILNRPYIASALEKAKRGFSSQGKGLPDGHTVGMLDNVKRRLDARITAIDEAQAKGQLRSDELLDKLDLEAERDALVQKIDDLTGGAYATARGVAEEGIKTREAFRSGTGALRQRADNLQQDVAAATPDDRGLMLEGAATELQERVTSRNPTNAASVFDPKARRNLDILTESMPAQRQTIRDTYDRANRLNSQARASTMRGQSTTASTLRGQQDLEDKVSPLGLEQGLEIGGKLIRGNWSGMLADAIRTANARYRRGVTSDVAGEVADILTTRMGDDVSRSDVVRLMQQAMAKEAAKRAGARGRRVGAGAVAGATAGSSARP